MATWTEDVFSSIRGYILWCQSVAVDPLDGGASNVLELIKLWGNLYCEGVNINPEDDWATYLPGYAGSDAGNADGLCMGAVNLPAVQCIYNFDTTGGTNHRYARVAAIYALWVAEGRYLYDFTGSKTERISCLSGDGDGDTHDGDITCADMTKFIRYVRSKLSASQRLLFDKILVDYSTLADDDLQSALLCTLTALDITGQTPGSYY